MMAVSTWQQLNVIAKAFGDSFYMLDLDKFQSNYQQFLKAFKSVYSQTQLAYSYKTNYTPRLCQLVQQMGGYAEVVSGMEYALALKIGVPAQNIIFNGPYKQRADFDKALLLGSVINIDSAYEITWLAELAQQYPEKTLRIGLRYNFSEIVGIKNFSRFGFDRHAFKAAVQTLQRIGNCHLVGIHCHVMPKERSAVAYKAVAEEMINLTQIESLSDELEFIDLGGGFFSPMTAALEKQFPHPIPTFEEYGQAIGDVFAKAYPEGRGPMLILEPGISIAANMMQFISKVIDIKIVDKQPLALVSGSQYDIKPTLSPRNLPITVVSDIDDGKAYSELDIVGSTCMENDYLYRGYQGKIKANDFVIFNNVGAYTNVLRPQFISPASPILSHSNKEGIEVIRRRETVDDIFITYQF